MLGEGGGLLGALFVLLTVLGELALERRAGIWPLTSRLRREAADDEEAAAAIADWCTATKSARARFK